MGKLLTSLALCCLLSVCCVAKEQDRHGSSYSSPGHTQSQIGTLYDLRGKLASKSHPSNYQYRSSYSSSSFAIPSSSPPLKEARGYSYSYNPSDLSHPAFSNSYTSQDFHSRMGKVADNGKQQLKELKLKNKKSKNWDKYFAYKIEDELNSFNVHNWTKDADSPSTTTTTTTEKATTSKWKANSQSTTTTTPKPGGFSLSKIAAMGLGLNDAMTSILTEKLMGIIDQDFPQGIVKPLKHIVSSGNKMVEFWDKNTNARDASSTKGPSMMEMLGHGIEQLKKYRDGQAMKPTDPVANLTSPAKIFIQGMVTIKRLTNRVLGYGTEGEEVTGLVEGRGGWGHGDGWGHGWGGGGHMSYGGMTGLDPFALLAALAFGAFLLQLLLALLNTSARSLDVVDLNTPLILSDFHLPSVMTKMDKIFGTPTKRMKREVSEENEDERVVNSIIDKLDGMYKTYSTISRKPTCAKLYLCRMALEGEGGDEGESLTSKLYMFGLEHLIGDVASKEFLNSIKSRVSNGEQIDCRKEVKDSCDPSLLEG